MIIDIECAQKHHSHAINAIADCDVIIYVIPWIGYDDEESERLMRRYLEIAHIFRVKHFIVAITKIDYNSTPFITEKIFERATNRVKDIMKKTNIEKYDVVPMAEHNEDIEFLTKCPSLKWYDGPTLKEILSAIKPSREYKEDPFLLTVTHFHQNSNVIIGKVRRGMVSVGERVKVFPSGIKGQIDSIQRHFESVNSAVCGDLIGIKLKMKNGIKMDIKRGDIIQIDENPDRSEAVGDIVFRFSATIYVQRFRTSKAMRKAIPRILIESTANGNVGEDDNESQYIGVVTYGDIKVGDTVLPLSSRNLNDFGKIKWIQKVTPIGNDEEVEEAKCGDRIRFQVMISLRFGTGGGVYVPCEYPLRPKPGVQLKAPYKDDAPFWRLYPKSFETERPLQFVVFIGNGTSKCHIHCIKWKQNADGKQIENPEYLEQDDTAEVEMELHTPIHVTPYNEYPEFGAFVMILDHTDNITKSSFIIGKVNKIKSVIPLQSIYRVTDRETIRTRKSIKFVDIRRNLRLLRSTRKFLDSQLESTTRCDCIDLLRAPRYDISQRCSVSMECTIDHQDFHQLNICMAQSNGDYALSCGTCTFGGLQSRHFVLYFCNRISKMLKKVIPMEVVEIIEAYSRHNRQALRGYGWKNWRIIPELSERNICKMVRVKYRRDGNPAHIQRFSLEDNGSLWRSQNDNKMEIMPFFLKNKIVIKDIVIGKGICKIGYHCLAVDNNHNVYQFKTYRYSPNVDNPRILNFPLPENERVQRCVALKCGLRHFYVCLRVKGQDEGGYEYYLDRHFMFGYNEGNQCLTFDGREAVWTPFCINETVRTHYGGEIDSVFVDIEDDVTHIVVKHCYREA